MILKKNVEYTFDIPNSRSSVMVSFDDNVGELTILEEEPIILPGTNHKEKLGLRGWISRLFRNA